MALPFNLVVCPIEALGADVDGAEIPQAATDRMARRSDGQRRGATAEDRAISADRCGRDARILYEFRGAAHTPAAKEVA
jgi:hypothetical protein